MQEMFKHLQQSTAVITFDLALYSKAKEIHWRYPEEFQNLVIRGGGGVSHCTQLFGLDRKDVSGEWLRGCVYRVWPLRIELYYGSIAGKSYNRGIRGHKLIMEALLRLKWDAFCSWVSKGGGGEVESE